MPYISIWPSRWYEKIGQAMKCMYGSSKENCLNLNLTDDCSAKMSVARSSDIFFFKEKEKEKQQLVI